MFTGKLYELRSFSDIAGLVIKRDCAFAFAGKIPTKLAPRLVACRQPEHLNTAAQYPDISVIIVPAALEEAVPARLGYALCEDPVRALNEIQSRLALPTSGQWESFTSRIHPTATIMHGAYVAPNDVVIGKDVIVFPNAVIMPRSLIEDGTRIGPGTIIGADAFEVDMGSEPQRILPQSGGVKIGRHVDILAKCTIVRSTFGGFTEIGDGSKFDCQVHLAHDCRTGKGVQIAACAELSGRVTLGDNVFVGPNASISNGITIGQNSRVTIGAVVTRNVEDNQRVTGNFAIEHNKWLDFLRSIR